jgi:hypothetical protein
MFLSMFSMCLCGSDLFETGTLPFAEIKKQAGWTTTCDVNNANVNMRKSRWYVVEVLWRCYCKTKVSHGAILLALTQP